MSKVTEAIKMAMDGTNDISYKAGYSAGLAAGRAEQAEADAKLCDERKRANIVAHNSADGDPDSRLIHWAQEDNVLATTIRERQARVA